MKLQLYGVSLQITSAEGYQTFGVMAASEQDAADRFRRGESTGEILLNEVEVQGLDKNFGLDDVEFYGDSDGRVPEPHTHTWFKAEDVKAAIEASRGRAKGKEAQDMLSAFENTLFAGGNKR